MPLLSDGYEQMMQILAPDVEVEDVPEIVADDAEDAGEGDEDAAVERPAKRQSMTSARKEVNKRLGAWVT